jgi:hypothetical protein
VVFADAVWWFVVSGQAKTRVVMCSRDGEILVEPRVERLKNFKINTLLIPMHLQIFEGSSDYSNIYLA